MSYPKLENNVLWKNRSFYIGVGALGGGTLNQQNVVTLYDAFTTTAAPSQPPNTADATTADGNGTIITGGTGACVSPVSYWDIGVRGDTGPTNHASTVTLNPTFSVMTSTTGYAANNTVGDPTFLIQYCNGSRIPPEYGGRSYQTPPGISDATVPNPVFNLTPAATVDEGNNWINLSLGSVGAEQPDLQRGTLQLRTGGRLFGHQLHHLGSRGGKLRRCAIRWTSTDCQGKPITQWMPVQSSS